VKLTALPNQRSTLIEMLYPTLYKFSCMLGNDGIGLAASPSFGIIMIGILQIFGISLSMSK
jgi:hypothetical protein